jgi:hypothetical protein
VCILPAIDTMWIVGIDTECSRCVEKLNHAWTAIHNGSPVTIVSTRSGHYGRSGVLVCKIVCGWASVTIVERVTGAFGGNAGVVGLCVPRAPLKQTVAQSPRNVMFRGSPGVLDVVRVGRGFVFVVVAQDGALERIPERLIALDFVEVPVEAGTVQRFCHRVRIILV